jgi:hypothetical protein
MPSTGDFYARTGRGRSPRKAGRSRSRSAGESQMAVTAIDHGGRVVTVTSQPVEIASSTIAPPYTAFATSIYGGPLSDLSWQAASWSASLRDHALAVNQVIEAIASNVDRGDERAVAANDPRSEPPLANAPEPRPPKTTVEG